MTQNFSTAWWYISTGLDLWVSKILTAYVNEAANVDLWIFPKIFCSAPCLRLASWLVCWPKTMLSLAFLIFSSSWLLKKRPGVAWIDSPRTDCLDKTCLSSFSHCHSRSLNSGLCLLTPTFHQFRGIGSRWDCLWDTVIHHLQQLFQNPWVSLVLTMTTSFGKLMQLIVWCLIFPHTCSNQPQHGWHDVERAALLTQPSQKADYYVDSQGTTSQNFGREKGQFHAHSFFFGCSGFVANEVSGTRKNLCMGRRGAQLQQRPVLIHDNTICVDLLRRSSGHLP